MDVSNTSLKSRLRYWRRVLRPLGWWLVFVLVLFAIRTHQRLSEQTRLLFTASLQSQPLLFEASPKLDGQTFESGQHISLGSHSFAISHPKTEPFSTNLFIWYGAHSLGDIALKRSMGTLAIQAIPPAALLTIRGPEFAVTLTNSPGMTSSVPTDRYTVGAKYLHWEAGQEITVSPQASAQWNFAPRLGTANLTCNQAGASFQISTPDGRLLEAGELPATVGEVPEGSYKVSAWHHGNQREQTLSVRGGATNDTEVEFLYGAAVFETQPAGARVSSNEGRDLGTTPLQLTELPVGRWQFNLRRDGYEPAVASLEVSTQHTNEFRTNLVSINYARALNAARQYLAGADNDRALAAATEALQAKPDDPEAIVVQKEALGRTHLRHAEALGRQGDYVNGVKELEAALQALPENEEAAHLLTDFKARVPEQIERLKQERLERPKKVFDSITATMKDADLFENHELKTGKPLKEVEAGILNELRAVRPVFQVTHDSSPQPETFVIEAVLELKTALDTSAGRRQCVIVGSQTRDDETRILFKVLEYKSEAVNKFSIGALIGTPVEVKFVPIHSSRIPDMTDKLKAQVEEGTRMVTERIRGAIGEAQAGQK